jgi:lysyl-tRNA synthetase class I
VEPKDKEPTPQSTPAIAASTPTPSPQPSATPTPEIQVAKAIPVEPINESTIPVSPSHHFQVAALTPTMTQAVEYLKTIAASDAVLADNMAEFNRAECYIRWLAEAAKPFEAEMARNPESEASKKIEELMQKALDEVVALKSRRDELKAARLKELEARQAARAALENEIQTTRRDELARLTGVGA